jgi:putative ABC transport system substrate-binding protein
VRINRRAFLVGSCGAVLRTSVASAQPEGRVRRIAVLIPFAETDPDAQRWVAALIDGLEGLGWTTKSNLIFDLRWTGANNDRIKQSAAEAVRLSPDVILSHGVPMLAAVGQATSAIPVIFVQVADPVISGFVESLARPGRNVTGFTNYEYAMGAKWLEFLKQVQPDLKRVLVLQNPENPSWTGHLGAIAAAAPTLKVTLTPAAAHDPAEIRAVVETFIKEGLGGLISLPSPIASANRELLVELCAHHAIPAVYPFSTFVKRGGLMSYGVDTAALYKASVSYIDRILRGEKPAELPVQQPTKFELAVNVKTAKALGLEFPPALLATADDVIE